MNTTQTKNIKLISLLGLFSLAICSQSFAQTAALSVPPQIPQVFSMPAVAAQMQPVAVALKNKRFEEAERRLNKLVSTYPWHTQSHYLLASLLAIQGKVDPAIKALERAIEEGFANQSVLYKDPNLARIRDDKRFAKLAEKLITDPTNTKADPKSVVSAQAITNGMAIVSTSNTVWDQRFSLLKSIFKFNSRKVASATVQGGKSPAIQKVNELFRRGLAAGNMGDIYDNRDRGHSTLDAKDFPQLSFTRYGDKAKLNNLDFGFNSSILFNAPTIGNSSTAANSGTFWRSLARLGYTTPNGPQKLFLQYMSNHLYIYPAVHDFRPQEGDLLPANSPYMLVTEGKSGSDRPFLKAVASILAAMKPDVKDALIKTNKLMPAVQMIFRKGQKGVHTKEAYLTRKAHPAVFNGKNINVIKMITLANNLNVKDVPPVVFLSAKEDSGPREGIDGFATQLPEVLFNTPASLTWVIRNTAFEKRLVISTEKTQNPNGQPLKYKWVLLQGNPKLVKILPKGVDGASAEIQIGWHGKYTHPDRPDIETSRVEIGVFADNGKELSAPSFINILYPRHQKRIYDKSKHLVSIDHVASKGDYIDPKIFPVRHWRDEYHYDGKGKLTGWTRVTKSGKTEFSRHGAIVRTKDAKGRPLKAETIGYLYNRDKAGKMIATEKPINKFLQYHYLNDSDRQGILVQ